MNSKIIIFVNKNYLSKSYYLMSQFENLHIDNFLFICLDQIIYDNLQTNNKYLHIIDFENSWIGKKQLWIKRILFLKDLLAQNSFDILHCDADAVWRKNPFNLITDTTIDMFFTPGLNYPDAIFNEWGFVVRGGFYYLRNNSFVNNFMKDWVEYTIKYKDDQTGLNHLLHDKQVIWNIPKEKYYIQNYIHTNKNSYNILYAKSGIEGTFDNRHIKILSAFDFPRLDTNNEFYVSDLYNLSKYILSTID